MSGRVAATETEVVTYQPCYAQAFAELNYQWIEQYFVVESHDRHALENPAEYRQGGEIFFVLVAGEPVGCVAMVPYVNADTPEPVFELAKMAVRPDHQGKGLSNLLMQTCIDFARGAGVSKIMLQTNDILGPALGLYQRFGFQPVQQASSDRYARSNLEMWLQLE